MNKSLLTFIVFTFLLTNSFSQSGDKYFESKDYANAVRYYEKEVSVKPQAYLNLGKSFFALKEFEKAAEALRNYKEKYPQSDKAYVDQFVTLLERNDDPVRLENMGAVINASGDDYFPVISQDGKTFYFTSVDRSGGYGGEDIWYSNVKADGTWDAPKAFSQLNTASHECLMSISGDGNVAVLFGNYEGSFGGGDLFYSVKTAEGWSMPCNLGGAINTSNWESQATLAADGRTLMFSSNREGGQGSYDLYVTQLSDNGWSKPVNLGPAINTSNGDIGPCLAADGKTLYFNSYGHGGFGGSDIFVSRRLDDSYTKWSTPVNLGKYINSIEDDKYLSLPSSGIRAYTVKDNGPENIGGSDIYQFIMPYSMRPQPVFNIYGTVKDEADSAVAAIIRYSDFETGVEVAKVMSSRMDGYYRISLPGFKKYQVIIDMKGYLYYTDILDLTNPDQFLTKQYIQDKLIKEIDNIKKSKERFDGYGIELQKLIDSNSDSIAVAFNRYQDIAKNYKNESYNLESSVYRAKYDWLSEENTQRDIRRDYKLQTIKVGAKFELKNIFFDLGKASLRDESKKELDKLYDIMKRSDIIIELGGFTDNVGSDDANMVLSQERVNSVKTYLVNKGTPDNRIAAVGYGEQFPVASNETEEGRQKNRRVEVKITEIKPREGTSVAVGEEKKKEEAKFDLLATLQNSARIGGLPKGSACSDKIVYLPTGKLTENTTNNKNYIPEISLENNIYKRFNAHVLNLGFKIDKGNMLGAGITMVKKSNLRETHAEFYFKGTDTTAGGLGFGQLWTFQLNMTGLPLTAIYGYEINLIAVKDGEGSDMKAIGNIPIGFRYIKTIVHDVVIGPELAYSIGVLKPKDFANPGYFRIGVNARWKFVQGGLFYNAGKFINYAGFRAGVAF